MIATEKITALQALLLDTQQAHWRAPRRTNEHAVLGDLYAGLAGWLDELAEINFGMRQAVDVPNHEPFETTAQAPLELIQSWLREVAEARADCQPGGDDCLLNLLADMDAALYRARYKLIA